MDLDAYDKLELLRKARIISSIEESKREKTPIGGGNKIPDRKIRTLKGKKR